MRQVRTIRYQEIAEDLRANLAEGAFAVGRLLPSEAELSHTYQASRVTIRKALEVLRSEGRVDARQGFGWFVAGEPVRQPLARLGTLEEQLERLGMSSERRIGEFAFVRAPARIREVLGVDKVLRVARVNLADGQPFARVTVYCPEDLGAQLSKAQVSESSFYDLLPVELGGAVQTIEAAAADATDAELLAIPVGSPVLRCERITSDQEGRPVLIGEYVFPGHRTAFIVDLPKVESSIAPSGLRLVE
jgi:GntR family transcriptional regulator